MKSPEVRVVELREFVQAVDPDLQRTFPFSVEEVRESGSGGGVLIVKGHAAVFDKWSLDLGGFRERVAKGAFDDVLSRDPHVLHLWDHDTSRALSSTRSKEYPLELRVDPAGLRFYSKIAPTSYAEDLRVLLEGGVIDQSSFAFTVKRDEWKISERDGDEHVERTVLEVDQLFDVTTCAMGAYPTTDSALAVRSLSFGRPPGEAARIVASQAEADDQSETVAQDAGGESESRDAGPDEERVTAELADADARRTELLATREYTRAELIRAKTRQLAFERKS